MSGVGRARQLDDRLVPVAAQRLRRTLQQAGARRARLRARVRRLLAPPPPGAPLGRLRRLDEHLARRGPLGALRRSPRSGLLLALLVLACGAGTVAVRDDTPLGASADASLPQALPVVGPELGTPVADYLTGVRARAVEASRTRPSSRSLALVSFSSYLTPAQTADLLAGVTVRRVLLRLAQPTFPGDPTELLTADVVDVEDVTAELERFSAATAQRKQAEQRELAAVAADLRAGAADPSDPSADPTDSSAEPEEAPADSPADPADQAPSDAERLQALRSYEKAAAVAGREAEAYARDCACAFSALVEGPAEVLAELPALGNVRGVELAPPGARLPELEVRPLVPEVDDVVGPLPHLTVGT